MNSFQSHTIQSMRWIKPTTRRRAGQTRAHAILTLRSADDANRAIKDGLEICGVRTRAERSKREPLQCLKCRNWEHKAQACEAPVDTCGTCGENHRTSDCTNKANLYCVSCKSNAHASWDRSCPEFLRRCAIYDERHPENSMVYFPTEHDWTLATRPSKIPLEDRFPKHLAVNSLPTNSRNPSKPASRTHAGIPPERSRSQKTQQPQAQQSSSDPVSRILNRTQPNLVPLVRSREEGELSGQADPDTTLDHANIAQIEKDLSWAAEPAMIGGCQPDVW